jgi:uncharacterized membrane protein (DUF373 family)
VTPDAPPRNVIAKAFSFVEDLVYIGLGLILAVCALTLLVTTAAGFAASLVAADPALNVIQLLDRILLILLIVELLYTVQISFREHAVTPQPFLLVGLIAAVRRILIVTAEFGEGGKQASEQPLLVSELAVLSGLIVAIALSLFVLRRRDIADKVQRA